MELKLSNTRASTGLGPSRFQRAVSRAAEFEPTKAPTLKFSGILSNFFCLWQSSCILSTATWSR